jgi:phage terminase small subunit
MFDLLANQLKLYYLALDAIDAEKKVSSQDDYKRVSKNPAIAVLNHSHQEIINIMQKLSLSPFDKAKLKRVQNGEDEDSEELLDKLIN